MKKNKFYNRLVLFIVLSLSLFSSNLLFAETIIIVKGYVVSAEERERLKDVEVALEKDGEVIEKQIVGPNKEFSFKVNLDLDFEYRLIAQKSGFKTHYVNLSSAIIADKIPEKIVISLGGDEDSFIFNGKVSDRKNGAPLGDIKILSSNTLTGEAITSSSDLNGKYSLNIQAGYDYDILIFSRNYLKRSININYCKDKLDQRDKYCFSGFNRVTLNASGGVSGSLVLMDKIVIGKKFKVDNIYYDYNKATLRKDALPNLRKVLNILEDNTQITIELGSYADSRGSDEYNLILSQKRAESAVKYIVEQGISEDRIIAKGYGETVLTNECSNGVECSPEKHAQNRRTEFKIIGIADPHWR